MSKRAQNLRRPTGVSLLSTLACASLHIGDGSLLARSLRLSLLPCRTVLTKPFRKLIRRASCQRDSISLTFDRSRNSRSLAIDIELLLTESDMFSCNRSAGIEELSGVQEPLAGHL